MSTNSLNGTEIQLTKLAEGFEKLPAGTALPPLGGVTVNSTDAAKMVRDDLAYHLDARTARLVAHQKAQLRDAQHQATRKLVSQLRYCLNTMYGDDSPTLLDFGFTPRKKKAAATFDEKVQRHDKLVATRERNHTLGKKQKKALDESASKPAAPAPPVK